MSIAIDPAVTLRLGVRAVVEPLSGRRRWLPEPRDLTGALAQAGACFVTLHGDEVLLGCIGSLTAQRPLGIDVAANAAAAAFDDPRLPPVTADDLPSMHVEVSVLGELTAVPATSWEHLHSLLRPGVDGLLIEDARHRATFLPAVWQSVPSAEDFLDHLWHKAGLALRTWPPGLRASRYHTVVVSGWARDYLPAAGRTNG